MPKDTEFGEARHGARGDFFGQDVMSEDLKSRALHQEPWCPFAFERCAASRKRHVWRPGSLGHLQRLWLSEPPLFPFAGLNATVLQFTFRQIPATGAAIFGVRLWFLTVRCVAWQCIRLRLSDQRISPSGPNDFAPDQKLQPFVF